MAEKIPQATFVLSAPDSRSFPHTQTAEYCVMGRSNVGKSSFINHVFANRRLARVSRTPGKTVMANFYRLDNNTNWVDLPGYGYARASRGEQARLSAILRDYLFRRDQLRGLVWIVDIRHPGLPADLEAWSWLRQLRIPILVVLTKCDKVSRGKEAALAQEHRSHYGTEMTYVHYSVQRLHARHTFWNVYREWAQGGVGD